MLVAVLALPLAALTVAAFFAFSGDGRSGGLTLAEGSSGGSFHPIAGNFEPDDTELESCGSDSGCLEQGFGNLAYDRGPDAALALFDERMKTNADVEANCHRIAHTIGSAALARFRGNVAKTFSEGSASCASGYYHGILERAFVGVASEARMATVARSLCTGAGIRRRGYLDYQCRHGLGHGFMIQTGYDLPLALSLCARLETRWDEVSCTGGAFMENLNTSLGYRSRWLDDEDPVDPCNRVELRHRRSCYLRSTTRILQLNGLDWALAAKTCASIESRWVSYCFRSYGRDVAGDTRYAPAKVLSLCRLARAHRGEGDCLYGAARSIADSFEGGGRAAALCARASRAHRDACFSGLGLVVGLLNATDAQRRNACAELTRAHADACAEAAIAEVDPSGRANWG